MAKRSVWGSKVGFLLAAIGSAVGLGNIWRFGYMAYENGGGAFLVPYAVALVLAGIPLMILEYALGHREKASPGCFRLLVRASPPRLHRDLDTTIHPLYGSDVR